MHRILIAVPTAIVLAVSITIPLVAEQPYLSMEGPAAAVFGDSKAPDLVAAADRTVVAHWIDRLRDPGSSISVAPEYYGECFTNTRGGISTKDATRYLALIDIPIAFNFEKMRLPVPGKFFLLAQNTHGRGLTEDFVGDTQVLSNIDSFDNIAQIGEYWWEFNLTDHVALRLGKQDVNTEFLAMQTAVDFIQSSFGLSPSATVPTYPDPSMGAVLMVRAREAVNFKLGLWDVLPKTSDWGFSSNDVLSAIGAVDFTYQVGDGQYPGALELGATYFSGGQALGLTLPEGYGFYFQIEQLVYREEGCSRQSTQGLGMFVSYFPAFANGPVPTFGIGSDFVAGVVYTGMIAGRDEDRVGCGVAWTELFAGGTNQETAWELFYKAQLTPRLTLQPDLHYIATPSGIYRDALAVGIRFQLTL
jgi:porin